MTSRALSGLLLLGLVFPATAQQPAISAAAATPPLATLLPDDPKVRIGTLPNGIRYYIRQNAKPEHRAELRLVVNAGSVLENENQLGYAHFVEHTAFNGTAHFAKNDLVSYLQSIGVSFGADLNAYTGLDETVYILPVPTDSSAIVGKAFQILEDWAHGQVFDSVEVVKERGVVHEEWRGRKGAGDRMLRTILPVALKGSRYASRLPVGTEESIMSATPGGLRGYYTTWYRPDLMAVVAVGDFDPATIERQIEAHFSRIPRASHAPPRTAIDVPGNVKPLVVVATDKEATSTVVQVTYKAHQLPTRTVGDYRRGLIEQLYTSMLNARFAEVAQRPDAPFLGAGTAKRQYYVRGMSGFTLVAGVKDGGAERGLDALLTETRRVDQFGYLQSELDRAKQNMLRRYERAYAERDKTSSGALVQDYIDNYLVGDAAPGIEKEYELAQQILPTITLAEVNGSASKWITDENRVVVVTAPIKQGVAAPTEQQLLAVFDRTAAAPLSAYTEAVSGEALIAALPTAGRVTAERTIPGTDVLEWTLSNGARVLVKPTDFKADEILFSAYANGGTSLASNEEFMSASLASQLMSIGGVGAFSRVDLNKKLSGRAVRVQPTMGETSQGLSGSASPRDLETMLQLAHLQFTAPRRDTVAFAAFRNQIAPFLQNRGADPNAVYQDSMLVTMTQHDFRARPASAATFSEVSLDRAHAFYRDRFSDAANFTFVFVGNVDGATLRPLVERYLASLPATGRRENWRVVGKGPPAGVHDIVVHKGSENKATTTIMFSGPFEYTPANRFAMRALTDYFQIKLIETLREQLGGTYSPNVGVRNSRAPRAEYLIQVSFTSSPENVDKLTPTVLALIDTLIRVGPSPADVDKVRAQLLRHREIEVKQNGYWLGNIAARDQAGEDLAGLGASYDEMVRSMTPAMIQGAAKRYLNSGNYVRAVLLPEVAPPRP
jgi:zinc protease